MRGASAGGGASSVMRSGSDGESGAERPRRLAQIDCAGHRIAERANSAHVERDAVAGEHRPETERGALLLDLAVDQPEGTRAPAGPHTHLEGALGHSGAKDVGPDARIPAVADRQR